MRSGLSETYRFDDGADGLTGFARRQLSRLAGLAVFALFGFQVAALATWNVADPSFSHATDNSVTNAAGYAGAVFADLAMQFFGLAAFVGCIPALGWGWLLASGRGVDRMARRGIAWLAGAVLTAGVAACVSAPPTWALPSGLGGVFGDMAIALPAALAGGSMFPILAVATGILLLAPAVWLLAFGAGVIGRRPHEEQTAEHERLGRHRGVVEEEDDEDYEDDGTGLLALGAMTHWMLAARARLRRFVPMPQGTSQRRPLAVAEQDEFGEFRPGTHGGPRIEPSFSDDRSLPHSIGFDGELVDDAPFDLDEEDEAGAVALQRPTRGPAASRVEAPAPRAREGTRIRREAQASLIAADSFEMPSLHFLAEPKSVARDASLSKDALEQNARLLEGVLEDFGVKGEIIHVRPGPVVTLYELEPAPGIKSSRVIGLADDIARSMSAIACRVAVVPGRNAIGIELPNARRETVYLREILASKDFEDTKAKLGLALGKTINGDSVIADIAKMPHVLVAGTTGSGKSVAINTMILSILYRMTPEQCRLIMIDPKMLELSVYDGIPHLLTPVVTDPKKAVVALKWTVREMEDRYRKMSKVGVRNIDGFNQRVAQAQKKGEQIRRTVQTGFDRETGEAIYETEAFDLEAMPYIVVIIDEMADLMMVAGKDIEGAVQRLAQMARAAGIHVIMATQRPSVDVITGTIKANFPTRISFQVTSKIDSRTILGEQGAEQLLGMGDMLYMAGGGRIQRVHGPFVSDEEVERVVAHLKLQGVPEYLDAITEDDGEDEGDGGRGGGSGAVGGFEDSEDPYDQAVSVVLRDGKASTSYIQRRLGIGYNRAASIIERMEQEGIVGPANHAGKREILVPTENEDAF
ncbi:MAG: DNA translocase FtsK [Rhizobiaceae bacterium]|nr:DNA translocase FtsK [Rhizobiaceae bacterium]MCV0407643.1 DNA translocase FtsK [Rhizobiaceae bacterium]